MELDPGIWDQEIAVPASTISYLDPGVLKALPPGSQPRSITPSGTSYWARTAKIEAVNEDGEEVNYFVKVHQGEKGKKMVSSEFEAMTKLYGVIPEIVAKPIAWGQYDDMEDTYFFLQKYHEMSKAIPNVADFPRWVAEFHERGVSPDGKFGMPFENYGGNNPQLFPVSDTWEECFTKGIQGVLAAELKTQGPDVEFQDLTKEIISKVIPRLLRPLETGGRTIVPRLVHGDLWDGNASVDVATGQPMIFDATPLYAHNEYELAPWHVPRHNMTRAYIDEYIKHFRVSEPSEEFDDRGALYCLRFDLASSALYPGNLRFRGIAKATMERLVQKYGDEGYAEGNRLPN